MLTIISSFSKVFAPKVLAVFGQIGTKRYHTKRHPKIDIKKFII